MLQDQETAEALGNARAGEDDPIRCRNCGEALAPRSARIDLSPDTFVNPEGLVFELLGVPAPPDPQPWANRRSTGRGSPATPGRSRSAADAERTSGGRIRE